jgi:hypothetical protein
MKKRKGGCYGHIGSSRSILQSVVCGIRDNLVTQTATVLIDQTKGLSAWF